MEQTKKTEGLVNLRALQDQMRKSMEQEPATPKSSEEAQGGLQDLQPASLPSEFSMKDSKEEKKAEDKKEEEKEPMQKSFAEALRENASDEIVDEAFDAAPFLKSMAEAIGQGFARIDENMEQLRSQMETAVVGTAQGLAKSVQANRNGLVAMQDGLLKLLEQGNAQTIMLQKGFSAPQMPQVRHQPIAQPTFVGSSFPESAPSVPAQSVTAIEPVASPYAPKQPEITDFGRETISKSLVNLAAKDQIPVSEVSAFESFGQVEHLKEDTRGLLMKSLGMK